MAHILPNYFGCPIEFLFGSYGVAVMRREAGVTHMQVLVDVINAGGVEAERAAFDTEHNVAFFQHEFGQVGAVSAGDGSDFGGGRHFNPAFRLCGERPVMCRCHLSRYRCQAPREPA